MRKLIVKINKEESASTEKEQYKKKMEKLKLALFTAKAKVKEVEKLIKDLNKEYGVKKKTPEQLNKEKSDRIMKLKEKQKTANAKEKKEIQKKIDAIHSTMSIIRRRW